MRSPKYLSPIMGGILVWCCLVCSGQPLTETTQSLANDEPAIRALVGRLFELYERKNLSQLMALWSDKSPFLAESKNTFRGVFNAYEKIASRNFEIRLIKVDGEQTTLRVMAETVTIRAYLIKPFERIEK